jgi:hypothetical protein
MPVWPVLQALARRGAWGDRLLLSDSPDDVVRFLQSVGPRQLNRASWSFCGAFCAK